LKSADKNGWRTIAMGTQNSFLLLVMPTCMRLKTLVDLDSIIDNAVMKHNTDHVNTDDKKIADNEGTALLAYMSGQKSSCGDV
jgi:rRNA-processing protein FCF1